MPIKSIIEDDYYVVLDPDGNEIARGSKKDKRYVDIIEHGIPGEYRIIQPEVKVLLAGYVDPNEPPNLAPEWTSQPTPSFVALTSGTYDFSANTFDNEGDSLTYSLNASSAALPSGFSLASNGVLTADGTQTSGDTTGVIIDVDDGVNSPVSSSAFTIAVVVQSSSSPTLFDDLSDRAFTGEAGALAVNDQWASTIYEYIPTYAPTIPTLPTPTGDPAEPGSSGANPNAANEYLYVDDGVANFASALANTAYRYIFLKKGSNLYNFHGYFLTNTTTIGASESDRRWIIWWDPDTPSNVNDIKPWNQAFSTRVYMPYSIINSGASYYYWVGLCFGRNDGPAETQVSHAGMRFRDGASYHQFYRCLEEYCGGDEDSDGEGISRDQWDANRLLSSKTPLTSFRMDSASATRTASGDRIDFYQCVMRKGCRFSEEQDQIQIQGGNNHRIVSCEFSDGNNGEVGPNESWNGYGLVIEDNCFYRTRYSVTSNSTSGVATEDLNGTYVAGDAATGLKKIAQGVSAPDINIRFWGNRFHNQGRGTFALDTTPTSGYPITFSGSTGGSPEAKDQSLIDIRWNIFYNTFQLPAITMFADPLGNNGQRNSIVRNIFASPVGNNSSDESVIRCNYDNVEIYLNTFSNVSNKAMLMQNFSFTGETMDGLDMMGNFAADIDTTHAQLYPSLDSTRTTNERVGYNAYANITSNDIYSTFYNNDYEVADRATLNMGDFKYRFYKLTNPTVFTISGIVPTTSTPAAFTSLVPTSGSNQIGSRSGVGVDDSF